MQLLIETSIKGVTLAAAKNSEIFWQKQILENAKSSISLSRFYDELNAHLKGLPPVDSIILSSGPGSFTGLKVGNAFAQGFVLGHQTAISVFPYSAPLEYLSAQSDGEGVIIPATKTHGFACVKLDGAYSIGEVFRQDSGRGLHNKNLSKISEIYPANPLSQLLLDGEVRWQVVGDWPATETVLEGQEFTEIQLDDFIEKSMRAAYSSWANSRLKTMKKFEPFYLKKSAPEERLELQGKEPS